MTSTSPKTSLTLYCLLNVKQTIPLHSVVPIVLSSGHASVAPKSTRLIQDGDRYIFLVEDTRNSKVSSVPLGADTTVTKATEEAAEVEENQEEGEEETGNIEFLCSEYLFVCLLMVIVMKQ